MSAPTTSIGFSPTTPAAPDGFVNAIPQSDGATPLQRLSEYVPNSGGAAAKTASYTGVAADNGKLLSFNSASAATYTLPSPPPFDVWRVPVQNIGTGTLTIDRNGLDIDGAASNLTLITGAGVIVYTDGTNYFTLSGSGSGGGGTSGALIYKGTWSGSSTYDLANVVLYLGTLYFRLIPGGSGGGTPTVLQSTSNQNASHLSFISNVTVGSILIVTVGCESGTVTTPTDTIGTTYVLQSSDTSSTNNLWVYSGVAPSSGFNDVTYTTTGTFSGIAIIEITNLTAVNVTAHAYNGTSPTQVNLVTTTSACFIFAACRGFHNVNTFTALTGFTLQSQANGDDATAILTGPASTAGTYTPGFNITAAGADNSPICAIAFETGAIPPSLDTTNWIAM